LANFPLYIEKVSSEWVNGVIIQKMIIEFNGSKRRKKKYIGVYEWEHYTG
jgi:hypothetical protein